MNFNNRLSSTLANNIKLDSNVEHEAEKIAGGNIIWLVNRPAGVKIYVNSTPDRTGALVLNEANRGYKWEQLGEYGSLKLYDNFYIWTEGTNLNNDKIELQVSPNADVITPILGNTADKIAAVESVDFIKNIRSVDKIDSFSDKALIQLNNAIFNTFSLVKPIFQTKIMGEYKLGRRNWEGRAAILPNGLNWNISDLSLKNDEYYRIKLFGHFDLGSTDPKIDTSTGLFEIGTTLTEQTAHFCLWKNDNNATFTEWTYRENEAESEFKPNTFFQLDKEPYSNKQAVFDIYGIKYKEILTRTQGSSAYNAYDSLIMQDVGLNINTQDFILIGSELNQYDKIGILVACKNFADRAGIFMNPSCHCSLILTISKAYSDLLNT